MLKIRYANHQDLNRLLEIYNQAVRSRSSIAITEELTEEWANDWLSAHPENKYPIMVALENDEVVGFISLSPYRKGRDALKYNAEISYYLHKDFHRRGIGSFLMSHAIEIAKSLGYHNLIAILFDINIASIRLLEKFGFEEWGRLPKVIDMGNETYDHLYYGKHIRSD